MKRLLLLILILQGSLSFVAYGSNLKVPILLPARLELFLKQSHFMDDHPITNRAALIQALQDYDLAGLIEKRYLTMYKTCIQAAVIGAPSTEPHCLLIQNIKTTVSDLPEFKNQIETWFESTEPKVRSKLFVEQAADFLLDNNYRCQSPHLYFFFQWYFDGFIGPSENCLRPKTIFLTSVVGHQLSVEFESIDPKRLYAIHYLFAGKSQTPYSRFGHAMLHLVFCSPNRQRVGPECLGDLPHHRVVSFRASIVDPDLKVWDGLTGQYPSLLFISPLLSITKEYNGPGEFRDLISLPLKIGEKAKQRLFEIIVENHLKYQGRYFFFSNNCATETLRLIKETLFTYPKILGADIIRPDHLFDELINLNLAQGPKLEGFEDSRIQNQWTKLGLFYSSEKPLIESQWKKVQNLVPKLREMEIEAFWPLPNNQKKPLITQAIQSINRTFHWDQALLFRLISLERVHIETLDQSIAKIAQQSMIENPLTNEEKSREKTLRVALSSPLEFSKADPKVLELIANETELRFAKAVQKDPHLNERFEALAFMGWLQELLASPPNNH